MHATAPPAANPLHWPHHSKKYLIREASMNKPRNLIILLILAVTLSACGGKKDPSTTSGAAWDNATWDSAFWR
jgi:hypothetical protein